MFRCLIGLWLWMVCLLPLAAQEMIIEGKVRDANTHREIPGVNIYIRELDIGTVSNAAGRFQLRVIRP
ncbi:MAG: carboxypeptidase-like regulatory domain-containing protein, partial [Calditrichaeota bacterium]|nr:carboxypeptidase-like regulatory domain-containing protein [Calditrichota bacterium]